MNFKEGTIIGLLGPPGAGKGFVANYLASNYTFHIYSVSAEMREILKKEEVVEPVRADFRRLRERLTDQGVAEMTLKSVGAFGIDANVVVDGIRLVEQHELLKSTFGEKYYLIEVFAPTETRYKRILARGRDRVEKALTPFNFLKDDAFEMGDVRGAYHIRQLQDYVDATFYNVNSMSEEERANLLDLTLQYSLLRRRENHLRL